MRVFQTTAQALPTRFARIDAANKTLWRTEYLGPPPSSREPKLQLGTHDFVTPPHDSPQAFRIEQEAGLVVQPHFHFVDQFQLVVEGGGWIGRHQADPLTVHYAGAHTGYGPITAGPEGLSYVTMRAQSDGTGAQYLPAARERMQAVPKRYRLAPPSPALSDEALLQLPDVQVTEALREDDGLAAWIYRLPPNASATGPDPAQGGGQSIYVSRGGLQHAGQWLDRHSCLYLSCDEAPLVMQAGAQGLELVVCQYARR